ncbi:50S ribosomal protein L10 [Marispirochaeta aestuarii]|uniref:50S ribosomal protein L10 n=1 Tax=Marispirochaeta aestuarii TaxID=1963862 RepID=UPI0029C64899|nr:50S ribosomal protein L10 [Marispirochaeta aestuarii]
MSEYTVKVQQHKTEAVEALKNQFKDISTYIFTDYRGLSVEQISDLRAKLREQQAQLKVVKNRFAKIALKELDRPDVGDILTGPTAVALPGDEAGPVAKTLIDFAKDTPLEVKGGIIEGMVYDFAQVEAFSKLPTKLELISMLMSTMKAPVQNLALVLNAVPQKLVRTLQAVADKKQAEG